MTVPIRNVLFLCTGNSARSIMAEALLNHLGAGRFRAWSAGSRPAGMVNPLAVRTLAGHGMAVAGLRSKSWDEFARPGAPAIDIVITVCDNAAREACPVWPGAPLSAHWGIDDPAAVEGEEADRRRAFAQAYAELEERIRALLALPIERLEPRRVQEELRGIGGRSR